MANQNDFTTIQIPGFSDIVKIPLIDTPELKADRITRMKAAVSPVPQALQWIPDAINFLDDIQDTLSLALILAKPLLRRIPAALLGPLGWLLLANDVLNFGTQLLATVQLSRFPKRDLLEISKGYRTGRAARMNAAMIFLQNRTAWLPFVITAGQVSYNYTGYGLQLGTIMGAITDGIWSLWSAVQGKQVRIIPPPPSDPIMQASKTLSQSWLIPYMAPALTTDEKKLVIAGHAAAFSLLSGAGSPKLDDSLLDAYGHSQFPGYRVQNENSIAALRNDGFSIGDLDARPDWYDAFGGEMYDAVRRSIATQPHLDQFFAETLPLDADGTAMQLLYEQSAVDVWDVYTEDTNNWEPLVTPYERLLSRQFHENCFPPWEVEPCENVKDSFRKDPRYYPNADLHEPYYCRNFIWVRQTTRTPTEPGALQFFYKWRAPRWFPPLYRDQNWQLAWWLQLALAIRCGLNVPYPMPGIAPRYQDTTIAKGTTLWIYQKTIPLRMASYLVWGNAWSKDLQNKELSRPPQSKIPFCIPDDATKYPRLEGRQQTTDDFARLRSLLPTYGENPLSIEADWRLFPYAVWDGTTAGDPTVPYVPGP